MDNQDDYLLYKEFACPRKTFYSVFVKRFLDIILSFFGIICLLPLFFVLHICVLIDVGFPIIFKQKRTGKDCRPFTIYKYRNMNNKKDKDGNLLPPNERVTKFGKIFRASSLDELPQLFNILFGKMSFIGPRPLLPKYLPLYKKEHLKRFGVKPGLECPQWKKLDHFRTWPEQFDNDVWYAEHCSFKVDLIMLFKLVGMVLHKNPNKASAKREPFNDN